MPLKTNNSANQSAGKMKAVVSRIVGINGGIVSVGILTKIDWFCLRWGNNHCIRWHNIKNEFLSFWLDIAITIYIFWQITPGSFVYAIVANVNKLVIVQKNVKSWIGIYININLYVKSNEYDK